jgi:hypothetical protein
VRCAGGDQGGRIRPGRSAQVLPQGHQRQEADDAGDDHDGLDDAGGDEAEGGAFVLPPDHRVERDGGAAVDGLSFTVEPGYLGPNGAGTTVTELRRSLPPGAVAGPAEDGLGQRCSVPLPGDYLACLPAGPAIIGRRRRAANLLPSDTDMT